MLNKMPAREVERTLMVDFLGCAEVETVGTDADTEEQIEAACREELKRELGVKSITINRVWSA